MRFSGILVFLIPLNVLCQETITEEVEAVEISPDLSKALQMFNNSSSEEVLNSGSEGELLDGGQMIGKPTLDRKPMAEGVVRMKVYVDKTGKVTKASFDPGNSTTSNNQLVAMAKEAALTATFESHPIKPTRIGWIQFNFALE